MSKTILTDILRGDLGFEGVIVTDALDMAAITDNFSIEDTIRLTINAGADLLILPAVKDTNLFSLTDTYADTAAALVENGEISEARIDESVLRILRLKQKYGILDLKDYSVTDERIAKAKGGIGSAAHRGTECFPAARTEGRKDADSFRGFLCQPRRGGRPGPADAGKKAGASGRCGDPRHEKYKGERRRMYPGCNGRGAADVLGQRNAETYGRKRFLVPQSARRAAGLLRSLCCGGNLSGKAPRAGRPVCWRNRTRKTLKMPTSA